MKCNECKWSKPMPNDKEHLECHKDRTQALVQETQISQPKPVLVWPEVKTDDFCPAFEKKG